MEPDPPAPLSNAVSAATAAARRGDVHGVDHAYLSAASPLLAHAHCSALFELGAHALAEQRCTEYLTHTNSTDLQVLRAQLLSSTTDHVEATKAVRALRRRPLTDLQQAKLARVAALSATDRNDYPTAESELDAAERHFLRANHPHHLEQIGRDRLLLDVRRNARTIRLTDTSPRTPAEFLRQANAARRDLRYDAALALMTRCVTSYVIEPHLDFAVLHELTALLVVTRQPGAARRLFPLLVAAAGPEALETLPDATRTVTQERRLDQVRKLIADNELVEAEWLLGGGSSALWHLTAGELAYARDRLPQAVHHFREAADREDHLDVKALALRKLGDTYADAGDDVRATDCWSQAHLIEQEPADDRIQLLRATPNAHDSLVLAAVRRTERLGEKALPGLVIAVETQRRSLPRSSDLRAAKRWLTTTIMNLPRDQAVWMMHATPNQLHHVLITRRHITHLATDVHVSTLTEAIHRLKAWHRGVNPIILGRALTETANLIGLDDVLDALPPRTTRIAIVASDPLTDIPFAGLPVNTTHHLGQTHALSTLPSLSALPVLQRRSRELRGEPTVRVNWDKAATALATNAAVLATRWRPAAGVLEAYERHLAKLPRDRALQHALREVADRHPADWACWALHGDAGVQTKAGALRRRLRKNGGPVPLDVRPKVFLSFAAKDRVYAESLREELEARNVTTLLDEYETSPGNNPFNDALATSDYYVLLWSVNTPTREWATEEWTSAFMLELTRRRSFLFIVRLDEEPLPPLLIPRKHIDLMDAADRLVATWRADRKSELPVFPQPAPPHLDGPTAAVSVRSRDLGVTHVVMTPLHLTGNALHEAVHTAMMLPAEQTTFDGSAGMRFSYELLHANEPIPNSKSTVDPRPDTVDIEIRIDSFGPRNALAEQQGGELDVDQRRLLLAAAFRHLLP